ncbi:HXXEE domain-containing protein [Paenibacillus sediminis]|uniref:HXXEE domain-containing protein n=1 Tax=Paenibacillus sediminis TaxID=664909 RepID=A0ABS4H0T5_9BACL|nr:HXXEE domain-containing protein [Paenibacillus sediminis]MBP1936081.1 hypothetical protein [Paenibacillus sediminis]
MITWLDHLLSIHTVIWLFPIAFMFHDLEEIVMVESWMKRNRAHLYNLLSARMVNVMERNFSMSTASFAVAVSVMLIGVSYAAVSAGLSVDHGGSMLPFAGALAVFFLHAFTHIGQAIYVQRYTPGVLTSIIIVLPYSVYAYYRLFGDSLITWKIALLGIPVGFLCGALLLSIGHFTGRLIKNS